MTYDTSSLPVACGSCGEVIPSGMPVYRVTRANLPRCSVCVRRLGMEYLSPAEATQVEEAPPLDFSRFQRKVIAADLKARILDHRRAGSE